MCVLVTEKIKKMTKSNYLTLAEWSALIQLLPLIKPNSNALIILEEPSWKFASITDISKILGKSRSRTSPIINSLIKKDVLIEIKDKKQIEEYGRFIKERPLFINPNVAYAGNLEKVKEKITRFFPMYSRD